jgi:hypothetical protein
VAFSYSIVNSGFNQNSLEQALDTFLTQAAEKAATAGTAALGTALGRSYTTIATLWHRKAGRMPGRVRRWGLHSAEVQNTNP